MKTLKTLSFLLLVATGLMAQPNPDDLFISGYVTDMNGNAQANHWVCVMVDPTQSNFLLDTTCVLTNANGYYAITIPDGSVTGPNIPFTVLTFDSCANDFQTEIVNNGQGSVDLAEVDFVICSASPPCSASITTTVDSSLLGIFYTFQGSGTGTAPFTYNWWVNGSNGTGQTFTYQAQPNEIIGLCLTITDNNGCTATSCDTLYPNSGNCDVQITSTTNPSGFTTLTANASGTPGFTYLWNDAQGTTSQTLSTNSEGWYCVTVTDGLGCISTDCDSVFSVNPCNLQVDITTTVDSTGGGLVYTLDAGSGFSSYLWSTGETTQVVTVQNVSPNGEVICVTVADNNGCTATACDTLLPISAGGCQAGFTYPGSPGALQVGNTVQLFFDGVASSASTYNWNLSVGGFQFTATGMNPVFQVPPTLVPVNGIAVDICVTVTDQLTNCTDTYCDSLWAVPANSSGCQAYFSWAESNILGAPFPAIEFTDQSQGAAYWYWDFGDNSTSTDQNPIHAYSGTGMYIVCLTIISADQSCQDTYCDTVVVGGNNGGCDASFSNSGPTPIGYTFSANVQNPNLYYYWEIDNVYVGDGYEAYAPGFTNGVHTICLTVIDSLNNCSDTECLTITVGSPNCYGYIGGQIYAGSNNQPLFSGVVYLITFDQNTNQLTAVDSIVLDTSNSFFFGPLACGDYMVKAAAYSGSPYYANHIPTYYGNSPFWGFAQTISITQANQFVTADVTLIAANNPGGPGFIGGDVTQGANKTDPGDPLSGMQVMLFDLSGNAIAYTYTDGNGEFGFADLAWGTYQVYVEALGVQTIPAVVTIGPNNPSVEDVHILASESLISTGIEEFDFDAAISEVYPNPVQGNAAVAFNLDQAVNVDISVVDLTGRTISTRSVSVSNGENTIRIDTEDLLNGYYFLQIQDVDRSFSITRKFMRID